MTFFDKFAQSNPERQSISYLTRRDIFDYLLMREYPYHGRLDIVAFLERIFDLTTMPSTDRRFPNARGDIRQHMINNDDWTDESLLYSYLDLVHCDDTVFLKFLEECVHPIVLNDEEIIAETVSSFNRLLAPDGYKLQPMGEISGRTIYKAVETGKTSLKPGEKAYDVVLSYAGENREYVEKVAEYLKNHGVDVFYDRDQEVALWGKDLTEHLDKIYRKGARFCVMFISKAYAEKVWPRHERKSALARAVNENSEYILPARFDDTEISGLSPSIVYVDLTKKSPTQLGAMILEKLHS